MIQEKDLAYLAGIIDGEGSIDIRSLPPGKHRRNGSYSSIVVICNTNQLILDKVANIMSRCGIPHYVSKTKVVGNRKPSQQIICAGPNRCFRCLWIIEPYLVGKKAQANLTMSFVWSRIGHPDKYHTPYTEYELSLVNAIRQLNKKGPVILNEHTLDAVKESAKMCSELRGKPVEVTEMMTRLQQKVKK